MKTDVLNKNSNAFAQEISVKPNAVEHHSGSTLTLDSAADVGSVHIFSADCTVTLPATGAGLNYVLVAGADDVELTLSPNASDKFLGGCGKAADSDNKDLIYSNGKEGDCVKILADGTNGWYITHLSDASKVSYES